MTKSQSASGTRDLLAELCRLVADRAPAEVEIPSSFARRNEATETQFQDARKRTTERYRREKAATEEEYAAVRRGIVSQFEADHGDLQKEYDDVRAKIRTRSEADENAAKQELQETSWEATAISEATSGGSGLELDDIKKHLETRWEELQAIHREAVEKLKKRGHWREYRDPRPSVTPPEHDPMHRFAQAISLARSQLQAFPGPAIFRLIQGVWLFGLFVLLCLAAIVPSGLALQWPSWQWVTAGCVGMLVLLVVIGTRLRRVAGRRSARAYLGLRQIYVDAGLVRPDTLELAREEFECQYAISMQRRNSELLAANDKFAKNMADLKQRTENDLEQADENYLPRLAKMRERHDRQLQETDDKYSRILSDLDNRYRADSDRLLDDYSRTMLQSGQRFQQEWRAMAEQWEQGMEQFQASVGELNRTCDALFPDWSGLDWSDWTPPAEIPPAIRFGKHEVKLSQLNGGMPKDERLLPAQTEFTLSALLPFPERSLLLLKAEGDARDRAIDVIQSVMLRMLISHPPGKVRFTIIDPVGLGENFSAFMHLADYDEQLVANRIWTEKSHIEQRLTDLTEHMETVIQVYLRNEFQTIQEYNESAGELAEPYRILVIANFPANFSESAAHRLASIVTSGARCGVFTLLSVDTQMPAPRGFELANLEPHSLALYWRKGRCLWKHPDFGELELQFNAPAPAEQFTRIVRAVGSKVKDADRVEVPFECALPEDGQWWTADSRSGIDVPLGRAGAMKLQHLNLGKGTSQHVLISGKTGSGKSTLLHGLITNLAVRYSPDQIRFYLVDFKKGVEFKGYASEELPHARVIAIESEREFGLSVLERLDLELKNRGDLFRKLGVQDIQGFRAAKPDERLPRVLLIIDEFQELFVEDDRIAQNSSLLLDRLVRQGRAFGIHVFLGSQTLAGAYSLARSTLGQMAVRIALQCSETDAHLILSEDNTAARLLTRPGEAIYNDANGLFEGNHPFQAVWLPDDQREDYLRRIQDLAQERNCTLPPAIVFEGNVPADPSKNPLLEEVLAAAWPERSHTVRAWLGSAVAIKDPTAAQFARQSGSNLLIVGQQDESAMGILAMCFISLAAQIAPSKLPTGTQFYLFDGARPDAPEAGYLKRLASAVPHAVKVITPRRTPEAIAEISEEVARREGSGEEDAPPIYLVIYNLSRFRDLRKGDDEFGFSSLDEDKPPSPAKQFDGILREGPAFGVHTLAWCDTYNNVTRILDRQVLRELEMRIAFQMNATDSSNLVDSPAASRLGLHRGIFYDEGQGQFEKFRPYGLPADDWLAQVKKQLGGR